MQGNNWHKEETYKSLIHYGTSAIKFVFIVNSGAILAMLTFLGNLVKNNVIFSNDIKYSMYYFIGGLISSGIATFFAYFTQMKLYEFPEKDNYVLPLQICMFFVALGMIGFILGSFQSIDTIIQINDCFKEN